MTLRPQQTERDSWSTGYGLAGSRKRRLKIAAWLKDVSPSDALRKEFHAHPEKWHEFRKHYFAELDARPEAWRPLLEAAQRGPVTLVYAAKDTEHNNAAALVEYLKGIAG